MDELKVSVIQTQGEISCNFDEIEAALKNQMQAYAELEVTEDNIPERKADVATLRKIKTAIDDKRKEVKRTYDEPLKEFEARVKKVTGIIDEEINRINAGLDAFEQKRIEEKRKHVRELYEEEIGEYSEFLPYEVVRSSKWDNKTCSDQDIIFSLQEMKLRVQNDLSSIKALGSEIEDKLITVYKASGNQLSEAIKKNADYLEAKKAAEARLLAEKEAEKKKAEESIEPVVEKPVQTILESEKAIPASWAIRVFGEEDIEALKHFLDLSGIQFEEV